PALVEMHLGEMDLECPFVHHDAISLGSKPRASKTLSHHCTGFVCVGSYSHGWSPIANASVIASVHWAFVKSRLDPPSITKPGAPSPRSIPGSSRQPKIVPAMKCLQSSLLSRNPCHVMQRDRSPHAALNRRRCSSLSISCQGSVIRSTSADAAHLADDDGGAHGSPFPRALSMAARWSASSIMLIS